ncbi:MAG: 50S ribosomal protein L15, partial [Phenylobacterium sp.]|nr:50S ribosomal protein L15 [Phenylobacterium sp.]
MTKLNELKPREGSTKNRMRVGRGEGSGKGKTGGRGVKGQKARSGVAIAGFEGGQMPLHMRMPKRGFNNPNALKFAEVNFWRLEQAIAAGKLDAGKPIDAAVLIASGIVRRELDGV